MIIVLAGAPGAGKGTQADLIRDRLGFRKISTGDALRRHVSSGTDIGKKAAAIMESGRLVPDDVLLEILRQEIGQSSNERILLDGYPRNLEQAHALAGLSPKHPVWGALHLDVPFGDLKLRLTGRRVCAKCGKSYHIQGKMPVKSGECDVCGGEIRQRPDDAADKVDVRLRVFEQETRPILDFYRERKMYHRVDGSKATEAVFKLLTEELSAISG